MDDAGVLRLNMLKVGSVTTNGAAVQSSVLTYCVRGGFVDIPRSFGHDVKLKPPEPPQGGAPADPPDIEWGSR